jgi:hypothetical protein
VASTPDIKHLDQFLDDWRKARFGSRNPVEPIYALSEAWAGTSAPTRDLSGSAGRSQPSLAEHGLGDARMKEAEGLARQRLIS